jgi:predicted Zn-dependent peptidase
MYNKTVLENGVRIVTSPMVRKQSVAIGIWINAGARFETPKISGISHFLEHLVFKGTKSYSCQKIKESIEGVGGALNGFTTEELTCFLVKIPSRYLDLALDILADMVVNPTLPVREINKERTVILEEIKMYKDLPQSYVYEMLDGLLWPDQPLGMSILGSTESVSRIMRKDLYAYKESYYSPENIVISAAGLLNQERFKDKVRKRLSCLKKKGTNEFSKASEMQGQPRLEILSKDTEQTHLAIGFHALKRDHPLKYALAILHIILGANSSSRLFSEIRENRGLAYEIGTLVKRLKDTGAFIVHAGVDNKNVEFAIKLIFQELQKVSKKPVTKDEFRRAKEFFLGQLMLALEDTMDQMLWIGESTVSLDRTHTLQQVIRDVNKVSLEELGQVSRIIFKEDKTNIAIIGPLKTSKKNILDWVKLK